MNHNETLIHGEQPGIKLLQTASDTNELHHGGSIYVPPYVVPTEYYHTGAGGYFSAVVPSPRGVAISADGSKILVASSSGGIPVRRWRVFIHPP